MRTPTIVLTVLLLLSIVAGCGDDAAESDETTLRVVATTGMIADAGVNLFPASVEVVGLMGPGVDPHLYKASRGDLALLQDADIVLYNGLHLEGKMGEVLEKLARKKPVIAVGELIATDRLLQPAAFEGAYDPHIWFDVALWSDAVEALADTLELLPVLSDLGIDTTIGKRAAAYLDSLRVLHADVASQVGALPENRRTLITAHDAFGYFGRAYDIEVAGLQGISTVREFGLAERNAIVARIVEQKIPAIFLESSVPKRTIEAIVEGVAAEGGEVTIGGELFSDAMGDAGTAEGTYIGMVRHNARAIVEALEGPDESANMDGVSDE